VIQTLDSLLIKGVRIALPNRRQSGKRFDSLSLIVLIPRFSNALWHFEPGSVYAEPFFRGAHRYGIANQPRQGHCSQE
jgi:hypothetical protein